MKEDLLKIIKHYGINAQQRQLAEEVFELQEAITTHEVKKFSSSGIPITEIVETREHIAEEIADIAVLLNQFIDYYDLDGEKIQEIADYKIKRQLERIKNE